MTVLRSEVTAACSRRIYRSLFVADLPQPVRGGFTEACSRWIYRSLFAVDLPKPVRGGFTTEALTALRTTEFILMNIQECIFSINTTISNSPFGTYLTHNKIRNS